MLGCFSSSDEACAAGKLIDSLVDYPTAAVIAEAELLKSAEGMAKKDAAEKLRLEECR